MRCARCGQEYPSKYYFVTDTVCRACFDQLPEAERRAIEQEVKSLEGEGAGPRTIDGVALRCPICGHERFWRRETLLNTRGLTFLGVEWANRQAENYVCNRCGHVLWFLRDEAPGERA